MNLFYQPLIAEGTFYLDQEESRHCIKVLRKKKGDHIRLTDGHGFFYEAIITADSTSKCEFEILEKIATPPRTHIIHIAVSPTKNADRIEWFVEKAVEFGIDKITLMECEHTERTFLKKERLIKVAVSAMKQSLKSQLPQIDGLVKFEEVVAQSAGYPNRYIAFVDATNPRHLKDAAQRDKPSLVLIGPEGDFSAAELSRAEQNQFLKVSLGESRLRTETAALAACHILNLANA